MNHRRLVYVAARGLALAVCSTLLSACQSANSSAVEPDYQTIGKDPHRDTEAAHKLNDAGLQLIAKGDYPAAERTLKNALTQDVFFGPAHNSLGLVYFHESNFYLAAWEFQYAAKLMPDQPDARNNLGLVFESIGKLDQAVDSYQQAMKVQPDNPQFIGNLARARIRRGDKGQDVRELLTKLTEVDTRKDWVDWAKLQLSVGKRSTTQMATP